jgi:SpoVK/Ycf46/Vps4 family AAA+-type ATPase
MMKIAPVQHVIQPEPSTPSTWYAMVLIFAVCEITRTHVQGRVAILKVHARGKAISKDVDYEKIARRTPGFTGADLQNLMNEAAIMAARRGLTEISKEEVADALERIIAGPEKVRYMHTHAPVYIYEAFCHVGAVFVGSVNPNQLQPPVLLVLMLSETSLDKSAPCLPYQLQ